MFPHPCPHAGVLCLSSWLKTPILARCPLGTKPLFCPILPWCEQMASANVVFAPTGSHPSAQKMLGIWVPEKQPGTGSTQARVEG